MNVFHLIIVHTSIFCNWQYWLVCSGLASRGFYLCNWHCSSQQCSTSVSHPGVHIFCSLHQKAWVHWAHPSGWVMHWGAIQHNLARTPYCTEWSWRCKVCSYYGSTNERLDLQHKFQAHAVVQYTVHYCKQCTSSYAGYSTIEAIYLVQQLIKIVIILLCSITEMITASPPGLRKSALLATNHSRQWYINATWSPDVSQHGPNLFCYSATDSAGWVGRICSL